MDESTATPEENFNNDLWYVLKKIREQSLYTKYGEDIRYSITFGFFGRPYNDAEIAMVKKLDEWKVVMLADEYPNGLEGDGEHLFLLKTESPRFSELYNLFNNAMAKNVSHDRLFQLTKELIHPVGTDHDLSFELWELSKKKAEDKTGKKKTLRGRLLPNIRTLYGFSDENRSRIKRFIELIQNQSELQGDKSTIFLTDVSLSLPAEVLHREGFSLPEAELLIETIDKVADHSFIKKVERRGHPSVLEFEASASKPATRLDISLASPSALQEIKGHLEAFERKTGEIKHEIAPPEPQPLAKVEIENQLSEADGKRMAILEKLKAEWDLTPKEDSDPVVLYTGVVAYRIPSGQISVPGDEYASWMAKSGINFDQFQRILETFRQEGLIKQIDFISEYR